MCVCVCVCVQIYRRGQEDMMSDKKSFTGRRKKEKEHNQFEKGKASVSNANDYL